MQFNRSISKEIWGTSATFIGNRNRRSVSVSLWFGFRSSFLHRKKREAWGFSFAHARALEFFLHTLSKYGGSRNVFMWCIWSCLEDKWTTKTLYLPDLSQSRLSLTSHIWLPLCCFINSLWIFRGEFWVLLSLLVLSILFSYFTFSTSFQY